MAMLVFFSFFSILLAYYMYPREICGTVARVHLVLYTMCMPEQATITWLSSVFYACGFVLCCGIELIGFFSRKWIQKNVRGKGYFVYLWNSLFWCSGSARIHLWMMIDGWMGTYFCGKWLEFIWIWFGRGILVKATHEFAFLCPFHPFAMFVCVACCTVYLYP